MTTSNKRSLADAGLNPIPSSNKARKTQFAAPLPPASENASRSSQPLSPPTLVGSVSNSPPRQPYSSSTPSVNSSENTSSSNASSLDQPSPHPLTDWTSSSSTHGTESVSPSDASTLDQPSPPGQHYSTCSSTHGTESVSPSDARTLDQPSDKPTSSSPNPATRRHLGTQNRLPRTSSTSSSDNDTSSSGTTTTDEPSESSSSESADSSPEPSHSPNIPSTNPRATTSTLTAQNLSSLPLLNRLDSLLPKLQSANEQLEVEKLEGRLGERDIENVKEDGEECGEGYIEMDLGLGVLEEKKKRRKGGRRRTEEVERDRKSGSGSGSDSEESDGGEKTAAGGNEDALATMMGISKPKGKRKVKIEEV